MAFLRRAIKAVSEFPEIPVYDQMEKAVTGPGDLLMVCRPSPFHLELATRAIDSLCHVFIEKPLSNSWHGVKVFLDKVKKSRTLVWIGYDLRFDSGLKRVKQWLDGNRFGRPLAVRIQVGQYLPDWRPGQNYVESITARKELGGGVLLELSHELDYARWLLGPVKRVTGLTGNIGLKMDTESIALALLEFQSGAMGSVHLDCLQRTLSRNCQVVCADAVIHWDYCSQFAWVSGTQNRTLDKISWETEDRDTRFRRELDHVIRCIAGDEEPIVTAQEGADSLRLALAIKTAAETQKTITLSDFQANT